MIPFAAAHTLPLLTRATYAREIRSWGLLALALGTIETGVIGVVMKSAFASVAEPQYINLAIAVVAGAPHYGNLLSLFWAARSIGRDKIRCIVSAQIVSMLCLTVVALTPISATGLFLMMIAAVSARLVWSGVITVRSVVWRLNYPRQARARLVGGIMMVNSLLMGIAGIIAGPLLTWSSASFRWIYIGGAVAGLLGALHFRRVRMNGHRTLLTREREGTDLSAVRPGFMSTLRRDAAFRKYMLWVFLSGFANLMLIAPLITIMNDHLDMNAFEQMMVLTSLPMLLVPLTVPIWSRLMDRYHSVQFHIVHTCVFVLTLLVFLGAATSGHSVLLWPAAVLLGITYAGGSISWNLGHHDFASATAATQYMSVHATLTGVRGVLAPLTGVALYQMLEASSPGNGVWILLAPTLLAATSAAGFMVMRRSEDFSATQP